MIDLDRQIHDYYDRITIPVTTDEYTRLAVGAPVIQRRSRAWVLAAAFVAVLIGVGIPVLIGGANKPSTPAENQPDSASGLFPAEKQGTILATTKAKPLPAQAPCPPESDPDAPGPTDQERPFSPYGAMAFDRHAGRIVALTPDDQPGSRTWTFDVCTNTWQRMHPPEEPRWDDPVTLVYDADSDRTVGFGSGAQVWSYDLAADRWTRESEGEFPVVNLLLGWALGPAAVYHEPSGLVVVYDGRSMWAYDVETNTMAEVDQLPDPSQPAGAGLPEGVTAIVYDRDRNLLLAAVATPDGLRDSAFVVSESRSYESWVDEASLEIWAFDPATGSWRLEPSQVPAGVLWEWEGYFYGPVGRVAFDQASGATLFLSPDGWVEAYDGRRSWCAFPSDGSMGDGSDVCDTVAPVYDPLNGRIVCQRNDGGVSAFSTATGQWTWLLEPER